MATITTRSGKGSPLTNAEVDANFTNLNTDKLEDTDLSVTAASASGGGTLAYTSGVFTFAPANLASYVTDLAGLGITATATELNVLDGIPATLTTAELGYVDGVTSAIQTQINAKGTVSNLSDLSITATATELNYTAGVTSAIQTQINAKGVGSVTSVGGTGTVNGISLSGTVTSSGNLTLGGALSGVDLTSQITGILPVANGGTGATSLTANNVVLGNGTSAVQVVAPSTSGNVLTSNGSTWASTAPSGSLTGVTDTVSPFNTFLGNLAGDSATSGGTNNVAIGNEALKANTTGDNNFALGYRSLWANTTGDSNVALGRLALQSNTASENVAVGSRALYQNTTGTFNVAAGVECMDDNTTGSSNTAFGSFSLQKNTTASNNTAIGKEALERNITGGNGTAVGYQALENSTATGNTALGYQAGETITSGANNIVIGASAAASAATVSNEITLGNTTAGTLRIPPIQSGASAGDVMTFDGSKIALQAVDATILKDADIGVSVLAFDTNLQAFVTAFTVPTADGTNGQALLTDGSGAIAFGDVDALPSQSGNSGKYLSTDGTNPSWATVDAGEFVYTRTLYTATSGQTAFNATYDAGYVDVFLNGIKILLGTEFTATNGTSITLATGAVTGDLIEILAHSTYNTIVELKNADGGFANSTYTSVQSVNGGSA